ncbi:3-deoxy-D-manno-octulosonic acid transferase [Panacagrimonas perspica]|nr:lipid IV(A) 3-deoxy-D-manno-octulosonic acid transferase [Panacagrimonas perspica]THD00561.1 3-deoxy-D-manno-octulosonic acid transferase [Panacagrimonas perspica]
MRWLYLLLLYLLTPVVLLRLVWRSRQIRVYRERIGERFGFVPRPAQGVAVWVHAVSVGESLAALPLIRQLVERHGQGRVWVTTTTPTGSERVVAALGAQVIHTYAPYDLPGAVSRFLDRARPAQVVIMETELWPTLFRHLRRRGIPLTIANARLSPRSFKGYGRVAGFTREVLRDTTRVAAQSDADAQRFTSLGAPHVEAIGNLKFDIDPVASQAEAGHALRARLGAARPAWVAASTHDTEEETALDAHRRLCERHPDALLILVPRHPQRFDDVARLIARQGFRGVRRSEISADPTRAGADVQVLLGDSLGEMWMYLAAADVAFVGGSLADVGGHNVLEPAALGLPVLFGPHMHNFLAARELLLGAGAAIEVADAGALASRVAELLPDAAQRARMGQAGSAAVLANRGALAKLLDILDRGGRESGVGNRES